MPDQRTTPETSGAPYADVLLRELESLIKEARPILMTDQILLDGTHARSLIQSIREALADERRSGR